MKQIFISYRRNGGLDLSARISDKLKEKGYPVFFDIESMRSGPFNEQIYEKIEECDVFLLVLPPNGLARCIHKNDWVRLEIEHAIKCKKQIIPIFMNGFKFPFYLPESLQQIKYEQGITPSMGLFDSTIEQLVKYIEEPYIKSSCKNSVSIPKTSNIKVTIEKIKKNKKLLLWILITAILVIGVWCGPRLISRIKFNNSIQEYEEEFIINNNSNINYYLICDNDCNNTSLKNSFDVYFKILSANVRENDDIYIYNVLDGTQGKYHFDYGTSLKDRFDSLSSNSSKYNSLQDFINGSIESDEINRCIIFSDPISQNIYEPETFVNFGYITVVSIYDKLDITLRNKYDFASSLISTDDFLNRTEIPYYEMYLSASEYFEVVDLLDFRISFNTDSISSFTIISDSSCGIQSIFPSQLKVDKEILTDNKYIYRIYSDQMIEAADVWISGNGKIQIYQPCYDGQTGKIIDHTNEGVTFQLVLTFAVVMYSISIWIGIKRFKKTKGKVFQKVMDFLGFGEED